MVNEVEKQLPAEAEFSTTELSELIDEITPDLEELSGRMARIRQLLNSEDTSPKERREALRAIGQIFKYGMCEGFDSMYDVPGSADDSDGDDADEQLEKLREGEQSDDDTDSISTVGDTAVKHGSFPRNNMSEGALNE